MRKKKIISADDELIKKIKRSLENIKNGKLKE